MLNNTDQSVCHQVQFFIFSILGFDHLAVHLWHLFSLWRTLETDHLEHLYIGLSTQDRSPRPGNLVGR